MASKVKQDQIEKLTKIIKKWNSDRLDLFEISLPNEHGEFFGVMRFYFQEEGEKVATKCIRVTSTATTLHVIDTLIEKFRPDMRLLSRPAYSLYEVHINGDERKIEDDEKPLLVQLNWNKDDREGRFLLKREDDPTQNANLDNTYYNGSVVEDGSYAEEGNITQDHSFFSALTAAGTLFKNSRNLHHHSNQLNNTVLGLGNGEPMGGAYRGQDQNDTSVISNNSTMTNTKMNVSNSKNSTFRRSKNKKKDSNNTGKRGLFHNGNKDTSKAENNTSQINNSSSKDPKSVGGKVSDKLYEAMPETSFTRSISNPEAVMRRRRAQKLEKKLKLMKTLQQDQQRELNNLQQSLFLHNNNNMNMNHNLNLVNNKQGTKNIPSIPNGGLHHMSQAMLNGNPGGPLSANLRNEITAPTAGMVKIYGESLKRGVPYKTLLLTGSDAATFAVKEILDKYGMLPAHDPSRYCLFKAQLPKLSPEESERIYDITLNYQNLKNQYLLEDNDIPLLLYQDGISAKRENEIFYVGLKPSNYEQVILQQREFRQRAAMYSVPKSTASYFATTDSQRSGPQNFLNQTLDPSTMNREQYYSTFNNHSNGQLHKEFDKLNLQENNNQSRSNDFYNKNDHEYKNNSCNALPTEEETTLILNESISIKEASANISGKLTKTLNDSKFDENQSKNETISIKKTSANFPVFIELNPDGTEITHRNPLLYQLISNIIEIGSEQPKDSGTIFIQLKGDDIYPKHCLLTATSAEKVYCTPCKPEAVIYMDGKLVRESTLLRDGACVRFGLTYAFRFLTDSHSLNINEQNTLVNSSANRTNDNKVIKASDAPLSPKPASGLQLLPAVTDLKTKLLEFIHINEKLPAFLDIPFTVTPQTLVNAIFFTQSTNTQNCNSPSQPQNGMIHAWGSNFNLSLAYLIYLACRHYYYRTLVTETSVGSDNKIMSRTSFDRLQPNQQFLITFLAELNHVFDSNIEHHQENPLMLTFFIANLTELVYALTHDTSLISTSLSNLNTGSNGPSSSKVVLNFREVLIPKAFAVLTKKLCFDIATLLPYLFQPPQITNQNMDRNILDEGLIISSCNPILKTLTSLMNMLKQYRLNGSIILQIFGRIFNFIEAWTINAIFTNKSFFGGDNSPGLVLRKPPNSNLSNNGNSGMASPTSSRENTLPPFSRAWGHILLLRVLQIHHWSQVNGLEGSVLPSERQFQKLEQMCKLLKLPKYHVQDLTQLASACDRLNSLQIYTILSQYRYEPGEPPLPNILIEKFVNVAHNTIDELYFRDMPPSSRNSRENTRKVPLLLTDPFWDSFNHDGQRLNPAFNNTYLENCGKPAFTFPDDGFSFDVVKGIPEALAELVHLYLTEKGLGTLLPLVTKVGETALIRDGSWNVNFSSRNSSNFSDISIRSAPLLTKENMNHNFKSPSLHTDSPSSFNSFQINNNFNTDLTTPKNRSNENTLASEVKTVVITKTERGVGLSIFAGQPANSPIGIYVRAVVPGGAAERAGAPAPGDQILSVNGISLVGGDMDEEIVASIMARAGKTLTLTYRTPKYYNSSNVAARIGDSDRPPRSSAVNFNGSNGVSYGELSNRSKNMPQSQTTNNLNMASANEEKLEHSSSAFGLTSQTFIQSVNSNSPLGYRNSHTKTIEIKSQTSAGSHLNPSYQFSGLSNNYFLGVPEGNRQPKLTNNNTNSLGIIPIINGTSYTSTNLNQYLGKSVISSGSEEAFNGSDKALHKLSHPDLAFISKGSPDSMTVKKTEGRLFNNFHTSIPNHHQQIRGTVSSSSCFTPALNRTTPINNSSTNNNVTFESYKPTTTEQKQPTPFMAKNNFDAPQKLPEISEECTTNISSDSMNHRNYLTKSPKISAPLKMPKSTLFNENNPYGSSKPCPSTEDQNGQSSGYYQSYHYRNGDDSFAPTYDERAHTEQLKPAIVASQAGYHTQQRTFQPVLRQTNEEDEDYIGPKEKIKFCQEMMDELRAKGEDNLNPEEAEKLRALVMEYEFQRRVLEEEEQLSDVEETETSTNHSDNNNLYFEKYQSQNKPSSQQTSKILTAQSTTFEIENLDKEPRAFNKFSSNKSSTKLGSPKSTHTQPFATANTTLSKSSISPPGSNASPSRHTNNSNFANGQPPEIVITQSTDVFLNKPIPPNRSHSSLKAFAVAEIENQLHSNDIEETENLMYTLGQGDGHDTASMPLTNPPLIEYNYLKDELLSKKRSPSSSAVTDQFLSEQKFASKGEPKQNSLVKGQPQCDADGDKREDLNAAFDIVNAYKTERIHDSFHTNIESVTNKDGSNFTPGVIGAQEVYLDPRVKLQLQKQKQQHLLYNDEQNYPSFGNPNQFTNHNNYLPKFKLSPVERSIDNNSSGINGSQSATKVPAHISNRIVESDLANGIEENSPERMSFRDKMKKFAQVSSQPPVASSLGTLTAPFSQSTHQRQPSDHSLGLSQNNYENNFYNNSVNNNNNSLIIEKLKQSKAQKIIEDKLLNTNNRASAR